MTNTNETIKLILDGAYDANFTALYGSAQVMEQRKRWADAVKSFARLYGSERSVRLFSVPGRSEISGNHTDHNNGRVLAAAVNIDIIAVVAERSDGTIRLKSEGFDEDVVDISDIEPESYPKLSSRALIAGICAGFAQRGYKIGGFDAYTTSNVIKGSGLSSSAAFEVMVANILNVLYNGGEIPAPELAVISQYSENEYFGKPCGLMDQTACAVGGFVAIDFEVKGKAKIEKLSFNPADKGYTLFIVNTGGSHSDLNEDYASIPREMKAVAAKFGRDALRGISAEELVPQIPALRAEHGDRAVLRALHFIAENDRVAMQADALRDGDMDAFLDGVDASGRSSFQYLQNVFTTHSPAEQGLSLALALTDTYFAARNIKRGAGGYACRVHGGGFAGTILAFVPSEQADGYRKYIDGVYGEGACMPLQIRDEGAVELRGGM
jgi:galactokinase